MFRFKWLNQQGIIHLIPLLILLAGIVGGVYLVSKSGYQIFKPKATSQSFEFINGNCIKTKDGEKVLTCKGPVQFKLISPLESDSTSDASFQIVKTAYAQVAGGKDYFCDPNSPDKKLIFHKKCSVFLDLLCDWELFGAKWEDIGKRCDIGQKCQPISQDIFESGAKCVVGEEETDNNFPSTPLQPASESQPAASITPRVTPRPTTASRISPAPSSRGTSQPTATPRPTTVPAATTTPTPTPTPTPASNNRSKSEETVTASKNATLTLFPASWTVNKGCSYSIQVRLNTAQAQTDGADVVLFYDSAKLEVTTITPGTIYPDYPSKSIDPSGKVLVSGFASPSGFYTGLGIFATINFKVLQDAPEGATQIKFDFDPNDKSKTIDSNVLEKKTNAELLTTVSNGEYTIGTGICPVRTTTHYRFSEDPFSEESASSKDVDWLPYTVGGVLVTHTFSEDANPKFIFAQFRDNQGNIINANPYPLQIKLDEGSPSPSETPESSSTPRPSSSSRPTSTPKPSATPVTTTAPTSALASVACDLQGEIGNWRNCTKEGLKVTLLTLSQETRDSFPDEALIIFNNTELLALFSKQRLSSLNSIYLKSFSNDVLLAIAAASGKDQKTFFSGFDCSSLSSFAADIKDLFKVECGF